ncbi:MAG: Tetratricopeptide repeat protein [Methanothrix sp.]|jgi:tetratricopeptide (TPR) repeat protein|nr:MAG: Tetratricopeptide repeat protein [Methanothrix sp.]
MVIEMSSPWIAGPVGAAVGAALAWIASEYQTRKTYRNVLLLLAKSADDFAGMGQLDKALSIYDQVLKEIPRLEPAVRGEMRFREGLCRYASSFEGARERNLAGAVAAFEEAIRLFKPEKSPVEHAQAQNGLGISLVRLSDAGASKGDIARAGRGGEEVREENLRRAILAFEAALNLYSAEGRAQERAQTENNLGDARLLLARLRLSDPAPSAAKAAASDLERAIEAYEAALKFRTAEDHPEDRAETQTSLGRAWMALAELEEGDVREENLEKAIINFKAALELRTLESHPFERAETQTLLGQALVLEAEPRAEGGEIRWSDREGLKAAMEAYEEALTIRTRKASPDEYAETKGLLARALVILSAPARSSEDAAHLKRAIGAFEDALAVMTLEAHPEEYATIQNDLGIAYRNLSKLEDREENLERSILAYEEALRARSAGARKVGGKETNETDGEELEGGDEVGGVR